MDSTFPGSGFEAAGLDPRLVRAAVKLGFNQPSAVQSSCLPKALEGKDLVVRARTGSGKTLAYLLPILHNLLVNHQDGNRGGGKYFPRALVLVPTRELCEQVKGEGTKLVKESGISLKVEQLPPPGAPPANTRAVLGLRPEVLVATPGRVAACLKDSTLQAPSGGGPTSGGLELLVLDEADLLLSYGYEQDIQYITAQVAGGGSGGLCTCQTLLLSATLTPDVQRLQSMAVANPVFLDVDTMEEDEEGQGGEQALAGLSDRNKSPVDHFELACGDTVVDKLLVLLTLLRLNLLNRKVLIFVNTVDTGYKIKLFLEYFGIRSLMLNAELPVNSRAHILQEFNAGLFDLMVATDDFKLPAAPESSAQDEQDSADRRGKKGGNKRKRFSRDAEFGVVRGVDFKDVRTVLNFDLPENVSSYVHRVGRTGRAGKTGIAVTLTTKAITKEFNKLKEDLAAPSAPPADRKEPGGKDGGKKSDAKADDEKSTKVEADDGEKDEKDVGGEGEEEAPVEGAKDEKEDAGTTGEQPSKRRKKGANQRRSQAVTRAPITLSVFDKVDSKAIESLRYRAEDISRKVGRNAIKQARVRELRLELLNSERLAARFEDNAQERTVLQHAAPLSTQAPPAHLKHIPGYIKEAVGAVSAGAKRRRKQAKKKGASGEDPLKTLAFIQTTKADEMDDTQILKKLDSDIFESTGKKSKGISTKTKKMIKEQSHAGKVTNARKQVLSKIKQKRKHG